MTTLVGSTGITFPDGSFQSTAGGGGGAVAWVNFNGTGNGTWAGGSSTVTRISGSTTATVTTASDHGLTSGNQVYALTGVAAGTYTVVVIDSTTFTITTAATTVLNAVAITFRVNNIRASHNVSSVVDIGVGTYVVNFITPMIDSNYVAVIGGIGAADPVTGITCFGSGHKTTTTLRVSTTNTANGKTDFPRVEVAVFR